MKEEKLFQNIKDYDLMRKKKIGFCYNCNKMIKQPLLHAKLNSHIVEWLK